MSIPKTRPLQVWTSQRKVLQLCDGIVAGYEPSEVGTTALIRTSTNLYRREHIYRVHPAKCKNCKIVLQSTLDLETHLQTSPCRVFDGDQVDGLFGDKIEGLKKLKNIGSGRQFNWESVFKFLFPGKQPIPSPCKS